jgi:hypothetical protein
MKEEYGSLNVASDIYQDETILELTINNITERVIINNLNSKSKSPILRLSLTVAKNFVVEKEGFVPCHFTFFSKGFREEKYHWIFYFICYITYYIITFITYLMMP